MLSDSSGISAEDEETGWTNTTEGRDGVGEMPSNIEKQTGDREMKHGVSQFVDTCLYMGQSCQ